MIIRIDDDTPAPNLNEARFPQEFFEALTTSCLQLLLQNRPLHFEDVTYHGPTEISSEDVDDYFYTTLAQAQSDNAIPRVVQGNQTLSQTMLEIGALDVVITNQSSAWQNRFKVTISHADLRRSILSGSARHEFTNKQFVVDCVFLFPAGEIASEKNMPSHFYSIHATAVINPDKSQSFNYSAKYQA